MGFYVWSPHRGRRGNGHRRVRARAACQAAKWDQEDAQQYAQQAPPPAPRRTRPHSFQNLGQLHSQGVLTDEEFAAAKAKSRNLTDRTSTTGEARRGVLTVAGVYDEIVVDPSMTAGFVPP